MTLDDRVWQRILTFGCQQPDGSVGNQAHCRRFIEAVRWMTRSGAQWRLLPEHYGNTEQRPSALQPMEQMEQAWHLAEDAASLCRVCRLGAPAD